MSWLLNIVISKECKRLRNLAKRYDLRSGSLTSFEMTVWTFEMTESLLEMTKASVIKYIYSGDLIIVTVFVTIKTR